MEILLAFLAGATLAALLVWLHGRAAVATLNARLESEEQARGQLSDAFRALSAEALESNNRSFLQLAETAMASRQQAIQQVVQPVRETLDRVSAHIHNLEVSRASAYSALSEQVRSLAETQKHLHAETGNLVKALRSPAARGRWGEIQLRRTVELAGMSQHCDFCEQQTVSGEEGRLRPDMIIYMPGNRRVVVDSKTPLSAYLEALECVDETARRSKFRAHAGQVRTHITKLSARSYWSQFEPAPDFVIAFLPGESFFSAALEQDPELIDFGIEQRVLLATPTTLIAHLKAIAYGWRQEQLAQNAQEISSLGREIYDRLAKLATHMAKTGEYLDRATKSYNEAVGNLESRVLVSARKLRDKGVSTAEELPLLEPIDRSARPLTAPELVNPGNLQ